MLCIPHPKRGQEGVSWTPEPPPQFHNSKPQAQSGWALYREARQSLDPCCPLGPCHALGAPAITSKEDRDLRGPPNSGRFNIGPSTDQQGPNPLPRWAVSFAHESCSGKDINMTMS